MFIHHTEFISFASFIFVLVLLTESFLLNQLLNLIIWSWGSLFVLLWSGLFFLLFFNYILSTYYCCLFYHVRCRIFGRRVWGNICRGNTFSWLILAFLLSTNIEWSIWRCSTDFLRIVVFDLRLSYFLGLTLHLPR